MALINAIWFVSLGTELNATLLIILSYAFYADCRIKCLLRPKKNF